MVAQEKRLSLRNENITLSGQADLIMKDEEGLIIVDFKTGRYNSTNDSYAQQIAQYALSIALFYTTKTPEGHVPFVSEKYPSPASFEGAKQLESELASKKRYIHSRSRPTTKRNHIERVQSLLNPRGIIFKITTTKDSSWNIHKEYFDINLLNPWFEIDRHSNNINNVITRSRRWTDVFYKTNNLRYGGCNEHICDNIEGAKEVTRVLDTVFPEKVKNNYYA